jgi:hypothetical protein
VKQRRAREMRMSPPVSNAPPAGSGDSFTPNRMTKKQTTMRTAGTSRTTVRGSTSTSAPPARAPRIAPPSSAATRSPAAFAVIFDRPSIRRERDQMRAISSGSHTT